MLQRSIDVHDMPELRKLADEVSNSGEPVTLTDHERVLAVVRPTRRTKTPKVRDVYAEFLACAGAWKREEDDDFLRNFVEANERSRKASVRPAVRW